jgi:hypothetical protein
MGGCGANRKMLARRVDQVLFLEWRKKRAKVECAGVEFAKSFLESPAADLPCQVARRAIVEDCPEGNRLAERVSRYPAKKEWRGVLGFDDKRFEPSRGDDAQIGVSHVDLSTTFSVASKAPT